VPLALANAVPAVHMGGGSSLAARKGMRAVPLTRCTVTCVVAVVSVLRVLFRLRNQLLRLWALGPACVRTGSLFVG